MKQTTKLFIEFIDKTLFKHLTISIVIAAVIAFIFLLLCSSCEVNMQYVFFINQTGEKIYVEINGQEYKFEKNIGRRFEKTNIKENWSIVYDEKSYSYCFNNYMDQIHVIINKDRLEVKE